MYVYIRLITRSLWKHKHWIVFEETLQQSIRCIAIVFDTLCRLFARVQRIRVRFFEVIGQHGVDLLDGRIVQEFAFLGDAHHLEDAVHITLTIQNTS